MVIYGATDWIINNSLIHPSPNVQGLLWRRTQHSSENPLWFKAPWHWVQPAALCAYRQWGHSSPQSSSWSNYLITSLSEVDRAVAGEMQHASVIIYKNGNTHMQPDAGCEWALQKSHLHHIILTGVYCFIHPVYISDGSPTKRNICQ